MVARGKKSPEIFVGTLQEVYEDILLHKGTNIPIDTLQFGTRCVVGKVAVC